MDRQEKLAIIERRVFSVNGEKICFGKNSGVYINDENGKPVRVTGLSGTMKETGGIPMVFADFTRDNGNEDGFFLGSLWGAELDSIYNELFKD